MTDSKTTAPETLAAFALVETMPEQHRESHRAARNWGTYPANGATREWMRTGDAEQTVEDDEDDYAKIVRYADLGITRNADTVGVCDPAGGTWWPNEETQAEIESSYDPEITAIRICVEQPRRGTWHS